MEYIIFGYMDHFFRMSRNEMALQFKVAMNIENQGLTTSLQEKQNYFPNNPIVSKKH